MENECSYYMMETKEVVTFPKENITYVKAENKVRKTYKKKNKNNLDLMGEDQSEVSL